MAVSSNWDAPRVPRTPTAVSNTRTTALAVLGGIASSKDLASSWNLGTVYDCLTKRTGSVLLMKCSSVSVVEDSKTDSFPPGVNSFRFEELLT